jgi:DNA-binding transcriptional regulator YbjK
MSEIGKTRHRTVQGRTTLARGKIAAGAMQVLAHAGVAGLTHRAVAAAAGVSLAATTYHFDTKAAIIEETSRALLDTYLESFRRMTGRIARSEETRLASLEDLVERVVLNALGRDRTRSLAWCELILHEGRNAGGRAMARRWYQQLDAIWHEIALLFDPAASQRKASAAIDLVIGLTFCLHPLGLDRGTAVDVLAGRRAIAPLLAGYGPIPATPDGDAGHDKNGKNGKNGAHGRHAETRHRIVQAAIAIIVADGAAGMSYGRIAEVAGMARSGPSYYFPTIDGLLETAQTALFARAKGRYRAGLALLDAADLDTDRLLDLTTAIYFREALEFGRENIGYYSVWMNAAQNPSLRPAVAMSLLDQHRAWSRRIASVPDKAADEMVAFRMQALFIGKLIRAIVSDMDVATLAGAREDFAAALRPDTNGTFV